LVPPDQGMDFRFRGKSGYAADIAAISEFDPNRSFRLMFAVMHQTARIQLCRRGCGGRKETYGMARFYIAVDQPNPSRLVGALRPGFHPSLDERPRLLLRAGSRLPAISGRPGPTDQMIFADMLNERVN